VFFIGDMDQAACEIILPAVEAADESSNFPSALIDDSIPTMRTHVVESPHDIVFSTNDNNGTVADFNLLHQVITALWDLLFPSHIEPNLAKDQVALTLVVFRRKQRFDRHRTSAEVRISGGPPV
jgi:hypothetical protein